jgi:tetratricopeptide (TPR) repeat protein
MQTKKFKLFYAINLVFQLILFYVCSANRIVAQQNNVLMALEKISQNNPNSSAAYFHLGQFYFFNGKLDEASKQFEKALTLHQDIDGYFFQALSLEGQGKYEQALDSYDKAMQIESTTEYRMRRGELRYKLKKYIGALQDFTIILEDYADMAYIRKMALDCQKRLTPKDTIVENNLVSNVKIVVESPKIFVQKTIQSYENIGDLGESYRGLQFFYNNDLENAHTIFQKLIEKYNQYTTLFFSGLIFELQDDAASAAVMYQKAAKRVENRILDLKFEKLAGSISANNEIIKLEELKKDYESKITEAYTNASNVTKMVLTETDEDLKGEMKVVDLRYRYSFTNPTTTGNKKIYALTIEKELGGKVLATRAMVETLKDGNILVTINHASPKKAGSLEWLVHPQDFLQAKFIATKNPSYKAEGTKMKAKINKKLDFNLLSQLKPTNHTPNQALIFAARVYIVAFLENHKN